MSICFGKRVYRALWYACALLIFIAGCSATPAPQNAAPEDNSGLVRDPVLGVADNGTRCTIPAITEMWHQRTHSTLEDFPLGPGDEIFVSVPEIEELQNQHARIAQDGTMSLPLIGTLHVGGLGEDQARAVISERLAQYMKKPRVEMYVNRYRSREVAVAGAVQKPGVFDLASLSDSLDDMIAMAGGLSPSASQTAIFLPAEVAEASTTTSADLSHRKASVTDVSTTAGDVSAASHEQHNEDLLSHRISITIPIGRSGDAGCLNLPARPGDVILVPAAGNVTVVGWVRNPGSHPITPGMTVLGAVTAAGGAVFSWHAEVMRTDQTGARVVKRFSLTRLENGTETDIPLQAGDVVLVEKSVVGAIPYGLTTLLNRFGTGVGMGIPFP